MRITVVERCETNLRVPKRYNVSARNRKIIDDVFDNLQDWANMSWSANATPFGASVFRAWRTVPIAAAGGSDCKVIRPHLRISVVDAVPFFYKWLVCREHRNRLAVEAHGGPEFVNVAMVVYCDSGLYA